MTDKTPNFENIIYLYICHTPLFFDTVEDDFFQNKFVSDLYYITKKFYRNYKTLPFEINNRSVEICC